MCHSQKGLDWHLTRRQPIHRDDIFAEAGSVRWAFGRISDGDTGVLQVKIKDPGFILLVVLGSDVVSEF